MDGFNHKGNRLANQVQFPKFSKLAPTKHCRYMVISVQCYNTINTHIYSIKV